MRILTIARLQTRLTLSSPITYVSSIVTPAMLLALLVLGRASRPTGPDALVILVGTLLAAFWTTCVWGGVGLLRRERQARTLGASMTSPMSIISVYLAKLVGAVSAGFAGVLITVASCAILLGMSLPPVSIAALAVGACLSILTGAAGSLFAGSIMLTSRHGAHLSNVLGVPVTLLSGTIIPLALVPEYLRPVSWLISLSWLFRWLVSAGSPTLDWGALAMTVALTAFYLTSGIMLLRSALGRARRQNSLEL